MITSQLIYNITFFSIIFMYFKILPINIETQPLLIVLLLPLIFITKIRNKLIIKSEEKYLYLYLITIIIYFIISILKDSSDSLTYLLKFFLGPISYILILKNVELLETKTLKYMTIILFLVSIVNLTRIPILYPVLNSIMNVFFDRYSLNYSGVRGMCILTPEPSYFVYFAMLLLFSFDFVEYKNKKKIQNIYRIMIYIMCILTKSAIVYMFLGIYIFLKYIYSNNKFKIKHFLKKIIIMFSILIIIFICIKVFKINLTNNRLYQVISSISSKNIFDILFFSDDSAGFRFLINSIYILSIFIRPLGYGFGGMEKNWSNVARIFNIDYRRNGMFKYSYNEHTILHAQALFPNVIGTIGIFSIFLIIFVYKNNKLKNHSLKRSLLITMTLFLWFLQSNVFNPIFWILVAFCKYNNQTEKELTS